MREKRKGIFKAFSDVIPEHYRPNWTQQPKQKPSIEDFTKERVAIRGDLVTQVLDHLKDKHFCIVVGPKDTGKTWLCYAIGFELIKKYKKNKDRDVWLATVDTSFTADEAWDEIKSRKVKKPERYIIIEDCHKNIEEIEELLEPIKQEGEENLRFVFTLRKAGKLLLKDVDDALYDLGEDQNCIVNLLSSKEHVKAIIKKFMEIEKVGLLVSEKELEFIAEKWHKDDLYLVRLRLKAWNFQEGQRLDGIKDDHVFDFIWSEKEEVKLGLSSRRNILLPISALCQFEPLLVYRPFMQELGINEMTLQNLRDEGIIELSSWRGKDFLSILENEAELFLRTTSHKERFDIQDYTKQKFKEYLKLQPPNWAFVFSALYMARGEEDRGHFAKDILVSSLQDDEVWQIVKETLKVYKDQITLGEISRVLQSLEWVDEIQKAKDFWFYCIQHKGEDQIAQKLSNWEISGITTFLRGMIKINQGSAQKLAGNLNNFFANLKKKLKRASATTQSTFYPILYQLNPALSKSLLSDEELRKDLLDKLKSSTAGAIRRVLHPLSEVINLRELFSAFSTSDLKHIIDLSNLNTIRLLFVDFQEWKLPAAANDLAKALPNANLADLIAQKEASLFQLNGLVENVEQVDSSEAARLIDGLSLLDLSSLISQADSKVINWFLSKSVSPAPSSALNIVDKVNDRILADVIRSASPEEDFWLLWNIYRASPGKAKRLVQINVGQSLLKGRILDALSPFCLALLGLLHLCNLRIENISLVQVDDFIAIAQALNGERSPTLLVLSLVALKVRLPLEQFLQGFRRALDEQSIKARVDSQPDLQLRELLQRMLRDLLHS